MSSSNMYRVGDYVYFENSSSNPYLIRRIEELNKSPNGNVEAKVVCFYRRRDISSTLLQLADKHARDMEEDMGEESVKDLTEVDRHQLNHRELYLSRQLDTLQATHIRGKCSVTLLNETESLKSYLIRDDMFFYSLVYDPAQKTLLADKGEIRVGSRYQAEIPPLLTGPDPRDDQLLETQTWTTINELTEKQIDQFLILSRSVGTFARALDCSSSVKQPSLHMSAAAASRDVTLFQSMSALHESGYDVAKAVSALVPHSGPMLCRDEMEDWSPTEANLFEEALEKYGKDFSDVRQDFLPWKCLPSIIEYYYMWKTSDRYVQQKRMKAAQSESKLTQVYIPNYNKPNQNQMKAADGSLCESCFVSNSQQWYSWGPPQMGCRLCAFCWVYWKKYGGLKMPPASRNEKMQNHKIKGTDKELRYRPPNQILPSSTPSVHTSRGSGLAQRITLKTKQAFFLDATSLTRLARRLCADVLQVRKFSRRPFLPINIAAIKAECQLRLPSISDNPIRIRERKFPTVAAILPQLRKYSEQPKIVRGGMDMQIRGMKLMNRPRENGIGGTKNGHSTNRAGHGPVPRKRGTNANSIQDDMLFVCTDKVREFRKIVKAQQQRSAARRPNKRLVMNLPIKKDFYSAFNNVSPTPIPLEPIVIDD